MHCKLSIIALAKPVAIRGLIINGFIEVVVSHQIVLIVVTVLFQGRRGAGRSTFGAMA